MGESIISVSVAGFLAGFILSMPVAGPISILVATNALKGRLRYCNLVSLGASIADFVYVFVAVFGMTRLYSFYKPAMPYIFTAGSIFFLFLGFKIIRSKIDIEHLEDKTHLAEKIERRDKGAFYTGFMINFLNPTLFIGVITSSFFVITLVASLGLNTGGLAGKMDQNVKEIKSIEGISTEDPSAFSLEKLNDIRAAKSEEHPGEQTVYPKYFHLLLSICYGLFLALGSIVWFFLMAYIIVSFRARINIKTISVFIKGLGGILCLFGLYFGLQAVKMFFSLIN